jgi:hypothetical protein
MKTSKHPKLANGQPAISCLNLNPQELHRRTTAAYDRAQQKLKSQSDNLHGEDLVAQAMQIARGILWLEDFATGLRFLVCDRRLFRVAADLPSQLEEANGGQALDFWDYGYVADELRELLTEQDLPKGDRQNLRRALAWVEEKGSAKRDFSQEA